MLFDSRSRTSADPSGKTAIILAGREFLPFDPPGQLRAGGREGDLAGHAEEVRSAKFSSSGPSAPPSGSTSSCSLAA
jgi:hypothetical protein